MNTDTVAALASPPGQGAIALIRMSGPQSIAIAEQLFQPFPKSIEARYQYFGRCLDGDGQSIDEVLFTYFVGPASFTGEDVVEIAGHGGVVVSQSLLNRLFELGARPAEPGEFSQRAFLNGKIDLTKAEAIMDIISAKTELAAKAASQQLAGNLGDSIEELRLDLIGISAHVEAYIDFPDEDIDPETTQQLKDRMAAVSKQIDQLLATADRGRILREGIQTVICGAPNAGKSSLLNYLVGYDRAIVSQTAGTTRDTISETINIKGIPLTVIDTAGIRDGTDDIEAQGIDRSMQAIDQAELILHVIDSTEAPDDALDLNFPETTPLVRILNKADLEIHSRWKKGEAVVVSCQDESGMSDLEDAVFNAINGKEHQFDHTELVAINARHQECLKSAKQLVAAAIEQLTSAASPEFVSYELREALEAISAVVGKTDVEEILGSIFSTFCIGK